MDINIDNHLIINGSQNYKTEVSPSLGRYLLATRDIKKGEVILTDLPLAAGPIRDSTVLCPGCYQTPQTNCNQCGWPMCSLECSGATGHNRAECTVLREKRHSKSFRKDRDWEKLSDCLMMVRCLLFKRNDEKRWKRLMEMETNWDKWSKSPMYESAKKIEELLRNEYGLSMDEFPSKEILTLQAILDINAYEVRLSDTSIQAAYSVASLAEHNCVPNTHKTICSKSLELTFRAATDIPKGSHITATYCDILWPTWRRQQFLQWSKFFICSCERCHSETECESHLASLICMDCHLQQSDYANPVPAALPILSEGKTWETLFKEYKCGSCNEKFPARDCQLISKKADDALCELDKYASFDTIATYETWLNKWTLISQIVPTSSLHPSTSRDIDKEHDDRDELYKKEESLTSKRKKTETCYSSPRLLLHPQNSLVLDACHTLFLLYPKEDSALDQLKRKESYGAHLMKATKSLFTGISKFRGTVSYELAMTKAAILVYQLEQNGLTDNLRQLAEEILLLLGESQELLKYEPVDQPEGKLAQTGASQLEQLTLFFSELFP